MKKWKWHILLTPIVIYLSKCEKIGFELMHHDSRNLIHFSFFKMQFSPPSLKIKIPKYNTERKRIYFLMLMTGKNHVLLSSVQEVIEIEACLLLAFSFCFYNQISSINFIDTCWEKGYSLNRQRMKKSCSFWQVLWQNLTWF